MHVSSSGTDNDGLLTEAQAADYLKLSIRTLQAWRIRSVGPAFVRVGRAIRYRRYDLLVWIKQQTVQSAQSMAARNG
jgi:hypothetical protein